MDNLSIYNAVRTVPPTALKAIQAGRLKGKSDINPMWRIQKLTEQFGPCGNGWKYEIVKMWTEQGAEITYFSNNQKVKTGTCEVSAFVQINLYFKQKDTWSEPIPGIGGSAFIASERNGPYTSDECYKMALTDAISVACKALGVAADVYWNKDPTKYDNPDKAEQPPSDGKGSSKHITREQAISEIHEILSHRFGDKASDMCFAITGYKSPEEIPNKQLGAVIKKVKTFQENG